MGRGTQTHVFRGADGPRLAAERAVLRCKCGAPVSAARRGCGGGRCGVFSESGCGDCKSVFLGFGGCIIMGYM